MVEKDFAMSLSFELVGMNMSMALIIIMVAIMTTAMIDGRRERE